MAIALDVPTLRKGTLRCLSCGRTEGTDARSSAGYLAHGWPKCCGYTMRLETAASSKPRRNPLCTASACYRRAVTGFPVCGKHGAPSKMRRDYQRIKREGLLGRRSDEHWNGKKRMHECCKSKACWRHKVGCPWATRDGSLPPE